MNTQKTLDRLRGIPSVRIQVTKETNLTPIELGLILTLIGVGVVLALPLFFPFLLG